MPKIPPLYQQQRQTMGYHTEWQDKRQGSQQHHEQRVKRLASQPGLHTGNVHRQNATHAMVQLLSILSSAQVGASNPAITLQKTEEFSSKNNTHNSTTYSRAPVTQLLHRHRHHHSMSERSDTPRLIGAPQSYQTTVNLFPAVNSTQSDYRDDPVAKLISVSNSSLLESSKSGDSAKGLVNLSPPERQEVILQEQTRHLSRLLEKNGLSAYKLKPLSRINTMVRYLSDGGNNAQKKVVKALLTPLNEYGSGQGESISAERQMGVIAAYLNQVILGMPLYEWIAQKIQTVRQYDLSWFNNKYLNRRINVVLRYSLTADKLSQDARIYYRDNVLKKLLPTLSLPINEQDKQELNKINIMQPRWGFIHAGALLLNDAGVGLDKWTLTDIEDCGISLHSMLSQGTVPAEYAGYFKLPALIYYIRYFNNAGEPGASIDRNMYTVLLRYFDHIKKWEKQNDLLTPFLELSRVWKTRADLAEEILKKEFNLTEVSVSWVTSYLNGHTEKRYFIVKNELAPNLPDIPGYVPIRKMFSDDPDPLPDINAIFEVQNLKLTESRHALEKLVFPGVFKSLNKHEQQFIAKAKVSRVKIRFAIKFSREWYLQQAISGRSAHEIDQGNIPSYLIPDHTDMLQCILNGEERIYALHYSRDMHKYVIERVDRERKRLVALLDERSISSDPEYIPSLNLDYHPKVIGSHTVKEQNEAFPKLIDNLIEYRTNRFLRELDVQGYSKTSNDRFGEFMLRLIPFYTCIMERTEENIAEANFACAMDLTALISFVGEISLTTMKFGSALQRASVEAMKYGARRTTIAEILKVTGRELIKRFPSIAEQASPSVLRRLGIEFARGMDPGFELLTSIGSKGIRAMQNAFSKLSGKSKGLTSLSTALGRKAADLASDSARKDLKILSVFSPAHERKLKVAVVGENEGKQIWNQVDPETGEFFGQKFILDASGNLEVVDIKVRHLRGEIDKVKGRRRETLQEDELRDVMPKKYGMKMIGQNLFSQKNVVKNRIEQSPYIQYYTKLTNNEKGSEVLVLTSHGGFHDDDIDPKFFVPPVKLPPDITIKMLTPHGTLLVDPGLDDLVNAGADLKTYLTISNGEAKVDFLPQKGSSKWKFDDDYDPENYFPVYGGEDGLKNYRHSKFKKDTDKIIAKTLLKNRKMSERGEAVLTDVLAVRKNINKYGDKTSLKDASVQRVIDLDKEGKLLNEKGERYKTIVFSHCRASLSQSELYTSSYYMLPKQLEANLRRNAPKGATIVSEVEMTSLRRQDVSKAFEVKNYKSDYFIYFPAIPRTLRTDSNEYGQKPDGKVEQELKLK